MNKTDAPTGDRKTEYKNLQQTVRVVQIGDDGLCKPAGVGDLWGGSVTLTSLPRSKAEGQIKQVEYNLRHTLSAAQGAVDTPNAEYKQHLIEEVLLDLKRLKGDINQIKDKLDIHGEYL